MTPRKLCQLLVQAIEDTQGIEIVVRDVVRLMDIADFIIICSGSSFRHLHAVMQRLVDVAKKHLVPLRTEGESRSGWMLIDLGSIIIHIMLPDIRQYYALEDFLDEMSMRRVSSSSVS